MAASGPSGQPGTQAGDHRAGWLNNRSTDFTQEGPVSKGISEVTLGK